MTRLTQRRAARRTPVGPPQLPWRQLRNPYRPLEILSADQIELIHESSLDVLERLGLEFLHDGTLDRLAQAGATVDRATRRVRFDRAMVMELVAKAPSEFTLIPRNAERAVTIGGNHINFGGVGGPPNCSDLEGGRRPGNYRDFCNLLRVEHSLNILHMIGGQPVAQQDNPVETRHLDAYYALLTLSDKAWQASGLGAVRPVDAIDMMCIARGLSRDDLARSPSLMTVINTNSPLRVDGPMAEGLTAMAEHGQGVIVTPFTLAGAMAPVTVAGALVQQNAEALGVIALVQLIRPGCPVVYGGFTSNVDMKSGAPAFGTPEYSQAVIAGGQLARRYKLPYRSSNVNASNAVDAQAAYESEMSIWACAMSHCNVVYHATGWLEGGLVASFEKMILDAEMLQGMAEFLKPMTIDRDTVAIDAMAEVGPGGHFFGAKHTMERYEAAFYAPMLSDWRNFEAWKAAGAPDALQRASAICKDLLANYQAPPIDPAIHDALKDFVVRRKREIETAA
jgi:trimethylamine--corrinoid protein Co-methyltransferase